MAYSLEHADRIRRLLRGRSEVTEKQMFGGIAFLVGGNMAVGVHDDDLIVRVAPDETAALLRETGAKPFDLSGSRTPAGWLLVAPAGHRTDASLRSWVDRGVTYASSLPAKTPTKAKGRK